MPVIITFGGKFNGIGGSKKIQAELAEATAQLEFADLFRGAHSGITREGSVRIDVQGPWKDGPGFNIQAQVGKGSIAALRIATSLGNAKGAVHQNTVVQAAAAALNASYEDCLWHELTGQVP